MRLEKPMASKVSESVTEEEEVEIGPDAVTAA